MIFRLTFYFRPFQVPTNHHLLRGKGTVVRKKRIRTNITSILQNIRHFGFRNGQAFHIFVYIELRIFNILHTIHIKWFYKTFLIYILVFPY